MTSLSISWKGSYKIKMIYFHNSLIKNNSDQVQVFARRLQGKEMGWSGVLWLSQNFLLETQASVRPQMQPDQG